MSEVLPLYSPLAMASWMFGPAQQIRLPQLGAEGNSDGSPVVVGSGGRVQSTTARPCSCARTFRFSQIIGKQDCTFRSAGGPVDTERSICGNYFRVSGQTWDAERVCMVLSSFTEERRGRGNCSRAFAGNDNVTLLSQATVVATSPSILAWDDLSPLVDFPWMVLNTATVICYSRSPKPISSNHYARDH